MKQLTALLPALAAACSGAQHGSASTCPPAVETAVRAAEPAATIASCHVEREDGAEIYEAQVTRADGKQAEVEVTPAGALVQIEEVIAATELPAAVSQAIAAKYADATVHRIERVSRPDHSHEYEIAFADGREVSFHENGEPMATEAPRFVTTKIALPGGGGLAGVAMDYIVSNPRTNTVWVPAGNTGSVDVIATATGAVSRIAGFPTKDFNFSGHKRTVGPRAASLGAPGTVYIGNRGDFTVCAVDEIKLVRGTCTKLDSMPDGVAYVAPTNEVWVTTPQDRSIRILDAATLKQKARLPFDGQPEGYAPDATRGRFYTNLEDKDMTIAIDLATHVTVAAWKTGCGDDGGHGIVLAERDGFLIVGCTARVVVLDVGHDGASVGSLDTGDGVDNVDYAPATRTVYAAAASAASLTVANLDAKGALTLLARVPTAEGARNGVVTPSGAVYITHSRDSQILVVAPEPED